MSIRITALYIVVVGLSVYAWKDWFKSLCGLILMMAVISHEDMPTTMFGIQGFNMWNILFLVIFLAWLASRRREGLTWDMPRHISVLLLIYLAVIVAGVLRAMFDRSYIQEYPIKSLISEELINTVKWALPGLLLFDGCRTRLRVVVALICILAMYTLVSVQVIRVMPFSALWSSGSLHNSRIGLGEYIGYGAVDISAMLAGASWAILAALPLVRTKKYKMFILAAASVVTLGQSLTGGRAGYLAWGGTGLAMCLLKWRKLLILVPIVVMLLPMIFPAAAERMLSGFGQTDTSGQSMTDDYTVTSGRTDLWPYVIDKIVEKPWVGYGRLAMVRSGIVEYLQQMRGEGEYVQVEAHNLYLETMLDNGILGSLPIILFWAMVVLYSARLFRSTNRLYSAVGGVALALTLAQMLAGIGAQHYYPRISTLGLWATMFLMLRVYVVEKRAQMAAITTRDSWNGPPSQQETVVATVQSHSSLEVSYKFYRDAVIYETEY